MRNVAQRFPSWYPEAERAVAAALRKKVSGLDAAALEAAGRDGLSRTWEMWNAGSVQSPISYAVSAAVNAARDEAKAQKRGETVTPRAPLRGPASRPLPDLKPEDLRSIVRLHTQLAQHVGGLLKAGALGRSVSTHQTDGSMKLEHGSVAAARAVRITLESTVLRIPKLRERLEPEFFERNVRVSSVGWDEEADRPVITHSHELVRIEQLKNAARFEKKLASFIRRKTKGWVESSEIVGRRACVPGRRKRSLYVRGGAPANHFRELRRQVARAIASHALRCAGIPATLVNRATAAARKKESSRRDGALKILKKAAE